MFAAIPQNIPEELEQVLLANHQVSIKRIVSRGQSNPREGWYDQADNEWVVVLQGEGVLAFTDTDDVHLNAGDYCYIPAHRKHRVKWTSEEQATVWLAIHFPVEDEKA